MPATAPGDLGGPGHSRQALCLQADSVMSAMEKDRAGQWQVRVGIWGSSLWYGRKGPFHRREGKKCLWELMALLGRYLGSRGEASAKALEWPVLSALRKSQEEGGAGKEWGMRSERQ